MNSQNVLYLAFVVFGDVNKVIIINFKRKLCVILGTETAVVIAWIELSVASMSLSVCLAVCPCSKRKTACAIYTKVVRDIVHGRPSVRIDPEVKRSNVRVRGVGSHVDSPC